MKKRNYKKYLFISLAFLLVFSIIFGSGIASAEDNLENKTVDTEEVEEKEEIKSEKYDINEEEKSARVIVPDDQLSLAIGKAGQNARLAARLTNWKIDIKSESKFREILAEKQNETEISEEVE